jgi:hypothetical protein
MEIANRVGRQDSRTGFFADCSVLPWNGHSASRRAIEAFNGFLREICRQGTNFLKELPDCREAPVFQSFSECCPKWVVVKLYHYPQFNTAVDKPAKG